MKIISWLLKAALFFAMFAFALNNLEPVSVRAFFGLSWEAPLVVVLLLAMMLGTALGLAVMAPAWLRGRRAIKDLARSSSLSTLNTPVTAAPPPDGP